VQKERQTTSAQLSSMNGLPFLCHSEGMAVTLMEWELGATALSTSEQFIVAMLLLQEAMR
jgi:hypothetical protein